MEYVGRSAPNRSSGCTYADNFYAHCFQRAGSRLQVEDRGFGTVHVRWRESPRAIL